MRPWVRGKETVLLQGPPGVGKTHLAVSLGVKARPNGARDEFHLAATVQTLRKFATLVPEPA